ncbi:MAG: tRNA (adenosine(37)-N6)-threonylcarbamoyltransferase complex dimerization subunit type 1 TsaB [Zetaproteobacteria bacterium]|nr:MAG: tRNA (adenosine(37)-N6)-threonylcarbamoyltransferase complex dimerization subunit type 1 TsaB [Zetaproteobacteria bacterium]
MPALESLLHDANMAWDDLELLVLVAGPGSFTGLRIAAATMAGLNSRLRLPVLQLSSLAVTARQTGLEEILVCEDARAGECYVGRYRLGRPLEEDHCMPWHRFLERVPERFASRSEPPVVMRGWQRVPLKHGRGQAMLDVALDRLAEISDWASLGIYPQPRYLQASQAERHAIQ